MYAELTQDSDAWNCSLRWPNSLTGTFECVENRVASAPKFHEVSCNLCHHKRERGPLTRYVKLRVAHAPGMTWTFPGHRLKRKPLVSGMHHGTYVTAIWQDAHGLLSDSGHARAVMHAGIANPRWRGKRSRRMRNPQFTYLGRGPLSPWFPQAHLGCPHCLQYCNWSVCIFW